MSQGPRDRWQRDWRGRNYSSPKEFFAASTAAGVCPTCDGVVRPQGTGFFCETERWQFDQEGYFQRLLAASVCPSCGRRAHRDGRGGRSSIRLRCKNERKVWTLSADLWRRACGIQEDQLRQALQLWLLGWTASRIQRKTRIRKAVVLRLFRDVLFTHDSIAAFGEGDLGWAVYPHLYEALSRQRRRAYPVKRARPGNEVSSVKDYIRKALADDDEQRRLAAARDLTSAVKCLLQLAAQGQFGPAQLQRYSMKLDEHVELLFSAKQGAGTRIRRGQCLACRTIPKRTTDKLVAEAERGLHRGGICNPLKSFIEEIRGIALPEADDDWQARAFDTLAERELRKN